MKFLQLQIQKPKPCFIFLLAKLMWRKYLECWSHFIFFLNPICKYWRMKLGIIMIDQRFLLTSKSLILFVYHLLATYHRDGFGRIIWYMQETSKILFFPTGFWWGSSNNFKLMRWIEHYSIVRTFTFWIEKVTVRLLTVSRATKT